MEQEKVQAMQHYDPDQLLASLIGKLNLKNDAALSALCRAVERVVREHKDAGVHAVVLMVDPPAGRSEPAPARQVYLDVFESGFSQDSPGYGYGV